MGRGDDVAGEGTFERTIVVGDLDREYTLHIGTAAWGRSDVHLVVDLHGLNSNPPAQDDLSGFRAKADEEGFVVAQPQAAGVVPTWQAGMTPSPDVDFLRTVIADVSSLIDVGSVFLSGFSNGGGMAHRFACDAPGEVTAIGTVAGAYPDSGPCEGPVPVIAFHGTGDPVVPFRGAGFLLPDVTEWSASWAQRAGCVESAASEVASDVSETTWRQCDADASVRLYVIADGGHGWPGTTSTPRFLNSTDAISATDLMWDFFSVLAA